MEWSLFRGRNSGGLVAKNRNKQTKQPSRQTEKNKTNQDDEMGLKQNFDEETKNIKQLKMEWTQVPT